MSIYSAMGVGPFGVVTAGYAVPEAANAKPPTTLTSSRRIDFVTQRYVTNSAGGFDGMDDIGQRVVLLVSGAVRVPPKITPRAISSIREAVIAALSDMINVERSITLDQIDVVSERAGQLAARIAFTNLKTRTKQTALAALSE